jgi:hypothetical protein
VLRRQTLDRFGFDFELLFLAQRSGIRIHEAPVRWLNDSDSKVRWRDYPRTFCELLHIVWNRLRGMYRTLPSA